MKIGIVEVCEPNHYTSVAALAETYAVDANNEVIIYTIPALKELFNFHQRNIRCIYKTDSSPLSSFLKSIATAGLDRIHINTIYKYYKEFAVINWTGNVLFTVHNTDLWFCNSLSIRIRSLIFDLREESKAIHKKKDYKLPIILFLKDFKRQYYRDRFIKKIKALNYGIIVYSNSQKKFLSRFVPDNRIIVFPFCIYSGLPDNSKQNKKLRLCIPGSVSTKRREYSQLFELLKAHADSFKDHLEIDLLGYIPEPDRFLLKDIEILQQKGIEFKYSVNFIDTEEFDERLSRADFILGNLKVQVNVNRKYGETKETGVIFNIIKASKPGILPQSYPVDEPLDQICLKFEDYEQLKEIILGLITDRHYVELLKIKALELVKQYTPSSLYNKLVSFSKSS